MTTQSKGPFRMATSVPDGVYEGKWGAYVVEFWFHGALVRVSTKDGVRGMDVPVVITVKNGDATITTRQ